MLNTASNASKRTGNDFAAFALSGFNILQALMITHNSSYYLALDKLVVNASVVPEPGSRALLGLAAAACAAMRRRTAKAA
ncbi:PEP-CTERM sorting domain-containing protein [Massilia sp. DWR3-1-1]|uniref:PEP-CTERM sorting domain-containing protein n=1 Tax=Massilia sp. DWR3-1-1 TaxID=2804559 RepID=UPI003CE8AA32